jgi:hypothetical protein
MGGKYEVRFYTSNEQSEHITVYTNSWLEFIKLRITKKVIYYKVVKL